MLLTLLATHLKRSDGFSPAIGELHLKCELLPYARHSGTPYMKKQRVHLNVLIAELRVLQTQAKVSGVVVGLRAGVREAETVARGGRNPGIVAAIARPCLPVVRTVVAQRR